MKNEIKQNIYITYKQNFIFTFFIRRLWHDITLGPVGKFCFIILTLSGRRPLSYGNQLIDLLRKSMDWFLYDNGLRHERIKRI